MARLINPHYLEMLKQFQLEMQSTTSTNEKKSILGLYHDASIIHLALHYTYSPHKQFGVTSNQCKKRADLVMPIHHDLFDILEMLSSRTVTGHDAIRLVNGFIVKNIDYKDLIFCILDKDLKLRANTSTINKVIPNCIPTFDVALAEKYKPNYCDFENEDWYASRKLDGVRCLAINIDGDIKFYSRQGKEFETLDNIRKDLIGTTFSLMEPNTVYDGEVCMVDEDGNEDFQGIMKEIRRKDHTIKSPRFVVFDQLKLEEFNSKTSKRKLSERTACNFNGKYVQTLKQVKISDNEELLEIVNASEESGYEGVMLRKDCEYQGKRNRNLLKVKKMQDAEYIVIGATNGDIRIVEEGKEKTINCLSNITIKHKGTDVGVGSGFSLEQRKEFGNDHNKILGKTITVQYFEESKNQNGEFSLRFPVIKHIFENGRNV